MYIDLGLWEKIIFGEPLFLYNHHNITEFKLKKYLYKKISLQDRIFP